MQALLVCLVLPAIWCQAQLNRVFLSDPTALCLDGSPGVYYIDRGIDPTTIVLYFEGGGWCGDNDLASTIQNCYQRSKTNYGSSKTYPPTVSYSSGILSDNANNHFRTATRIILRYCDGSGHQGTRSAPVVYKNTKLYFRGNNITVAQLEHLQASEGFFSKAKRIIVTGGSAGGLAAFLWTDYIRQRAATQQVYCVPDSGIFLDSQTFDTSNYQYSTQFMNLFKLSNIEISPPVPQCVKQYPDQQHKCMMAEYMAKFIQTPIFAIQSLYDSWSIENILHIKCLNGSSLQNCSPEQIQYIEQYHRNTTKVLNGIIKKQENGAWAVACAIHGFLHAARYNNDYYRIPMGSENSIDESIVNWIGRKEQSRVLMDEVNWPYNKPCSGLPNFALANNFYFYLPDQLCSGLSNFVSNGL